MNLNKEGEKKLLKIIKEYKNTQNNKSPLNKIEKDFEFLKTESFESFSINIDKKLFKKKIKKEEKHSSFKLNENNLTNLQNFKSMDSMNLPFIKIDSAVHLKFDKNKFDFNSLSKYEKFRNFGKLYFLLIDIFQHNQDIDDNLTFLNEKEIILLELIFEKKYKVKIKKNFKSFHLINNIKKLPKSKKRPEENHKLVFSMAFKYLKNKFLNFSEKKNAEKQFYNFYFEKFMTQKIKISDFFLPDKNQKFKSLSREYIKLIKQSKKFINDFNLYINKHLINEYKEIIKRKFNLLFNKWEKIYEENKNKDNFVICFKKSIIFNKKCKLPWDLNEVLNAIDSTKFLLNKIY